MEESILTSTKKILGLQEDYTAFDLDVITHINAALSKLTQIGVGPIEGFAIDDAGETWDDLDIPLPWLNIVKTYIYLQVRMYFDPPSTSFLIDAANKQLDELFYRLSYYREAIIPLNERISDEERSMVDEEINRRVS